MYRDDKYAINPNWPKGLLADIAEADRLYDLAEEAAESDPDNAKPELDYMLYMEGFESWVKSRCIAGNITRNDLDTIFKRYGWR